MLKVGIPVCVRMWRFRREGRSNFFPHTSHGSHVRSLFRFGFDRISAGDVGDERLFGDVSGDREFDVFGDVNVETVSALFRNLDGVQCDVRSRGDICWGIVLWYTGDISGSE